MKLEWCDLLCRGWSKNEGKAWGVVFKWCTWGHGLTGSSQIIALLSADKLLNGTPRLYKVHRGKTGHPQRDGEDSATPLSREDSAVWSQNIILYWSHKNEDISVSERGRVVKCFQSREEGCVKVPCRTSVWVCLPVCIFSPSFSNQQTQAVHNISILETSF